MTFEIPGVDETLDGFEKIEQNTESYHERRALLETVVEFDSWFGSYDEEVCDRILHLKGRLVDSITHTPSRLEKMDHRQISEEIRTKHARFSEAVVETCVEYYEYQHPRSVEE